MIKKKFNLRNMFAIAICLAVVTMFSACGDDEPIDDSSGNDLTRVPAVVHNYLLTPGNAQVKMSWDAPLDNGGSEITGYEVTMDNWANKVTKTANERTHTYTTLINGTQYTFKVRAVNANGTGQESALTIAPSGEDTSGTNIAEIYRSTAYSGFYNYETNKQGGDTPVGYFTLSENKIIFNEDLGDHLGASEEMFENASTGTDHIVTYFVYIGTWNYLYSGSKKIGIAWRTSDERTVCTGSAATDWAAGFKQTLYGQHQPLDLSDMDTEAHPIQGTVYE
jgi:hypothetical protein